MLWDSLVNFTVRPMEGFVYVPPQGTRIDEPLDEWIQRGIAFFGTPPFK
jgi:hypothetical protein